MQELILAKRHGEAEHNVAAALRGREEYAKWDYEDAPLTALGKEQAAATREKLFPSTTASSIDPLSASVFKPQLVVVSPLTRTLQTASIITNNGVYHFELMYLIIINER